MSGARRAALLLSSLSRPDRQWLLAQLNDNEQAAVRAHLDDAKRLVKAGETEVIDELTGRSPPRIGRARRSDVSILETVDPAQLHPFLDRLPPGLVGQISQQQGQGWAVDYLARKDDLSRRRYSQGAAIVAQQVTPAFLARVEQAIAAKFEPTMSSPGRPFEQILREQSGGTQG